MKRLSAIVCIFLVAAVAVAVPAQGATVDATTGDIDQPTQNGVYTSVPFQVTEGGGVADIKVRLRMTHPNLEDLHIVLRAPSQRPYTLIDGLAVGGDDLGAGPTDCTTTQWTEIDSTASDGIASSGSPPYIGTFRAAGGMDPSSGEDFIRAQGEWRLEIYDRTTGQLGSPQTGILHCAELELTTDTTNPTLVRTGTYRQFVMGDSHTVDWEAQDDTDVARFNVQQFAKNPEMGNHMLLNEGRAPGAPLRVMTPPGWSQCLFITAVDVTGNSSDPIDTCFARPLDDTKLISSGFKRSYSSGAYMDTVSKTRKKGASLRLVDAYFTDLALVVTKCPGCGSVKVTVEGITLGTYSLGAKSVKKQRLIPITPPDQGRIARTVDIQVKSSNKLVVIEGLGVLDTYVT